MTDPGKKLAILDFDGVLADSFDVFLAANAEGMKAVGVELSAQDYRNLFIGNIHKGLREMVPRAGDFEIFSKVRREFLDATYPSISLHPFAKELVQNIARVAYLVIVSSSRADLIEGVLRKNGIREYFGGIFGDSQESKLAKLMQAAALFPTHQGTPFFVSDTYGDILEGKKAGIRTIAVTWGFHDGELLKKSKPDFLIKDQKDVMNCLVRSTD